MASMEQAKRQEAERISGVPNVTYDLSAVFHNKLEGIAALETYKRDAEAAGDTELVTFFGECQRTARSEAERMREMLAKRLQGGTPWWTDLADRPPAVH
jgi:LmbE family N-acetylglucosaminyl deacetylase